MAVTSAQLRMARAALNWTVRDLAEDRPPPKYDHQHRGGALCRRRDVTGKIEQVLTQAGVEFIDENGGGPGVRLRKAPATKNKNLG